MSAAIFVFAVLMNGLIIEPLKSIPQIKHKLINTALRNRKSNCSNLYSAVELMFTQRDIIIQKPVKADMCLLAVMSG